MSFLYNLSGVLNNPSEPTTELATMVANSIRYGQLHEFDAENETVTAYLE